MTMNITFDEGVGVYKVGETELNRDEFAEYIRAGMLEQALKGYPEISVTLVAISLNSLPKYTSIFQRNRIIFGAPGTGKSNYLNFEKKGLLSKGGDFERVTFHPDYSYAQFVGCYKPKMNGKNIEYSFVPGPFIRVLTAALKNKILAGDDENKVKPYLLIIEELNRAKTAAVFGDVFQLLDRGDDGVSEYEIQTSEDLRKYLAQELGVSEDAVASIKIPDNMFIWATMNSADQGVFPLDTAFKRRWNFEYISLDEGSEKNKFSFKISGQEIHWDCLRRAINNVLASDKVRAHEDKLLGAFFVKKPADGPEYDEKCVKLITDKVLMYLFDDVARSHRDEIFDATKKINLYRFSTIIEAFKNMGIDVFVDGIKDEYKRLMVTEKKEEQTTEQTIEQDS